MSTNESAETSWSSLPNDVREKIGQMCTRLQYADCVEEFMKYGPKDQKSRCIGAIMRKVRTVHNTCVVNKDMTDFDRMRAYVDNELSLDYDVYGEIYTARDESYGPLLDLLFAKKSQHDLYYAEKYHDFGFVLGFSLDTPTSWYNVSDLQNIRVVVDRYGPNVPFSSRYGEE
jgi:hypothetical protein